MLSKVIVVPEDEFKAWYFGGEDAPEPGTEHRCVRRASRSARHSARAGHPRGEGVPDLSLGGREAQGRSHAQGTVGKVERVKVAEATQVVTVDEAYLRQAILTPGHQVVRGYPAAMPVIKVEPNEMGEIVAYIKNLK